MMGGKVTKQFSQGVVPDWERYRTKGQDMQREGARPRKKVNQPKSGQAIANCLTNKSLRKIAVQVSSEFPWFEDLDALWKDNPAFAPKTFSSVPGKDCAGGLHVLTQPKCKQTSCTTGKQVASHPANSSTTADDSMVHSQAKGKERASNFEPNDTSHPTTSQFFSNTNPNLNDINTDLDNINTDLDNINTDLDNMDTDLDDFNADNLLDKGVPPTLIGGHDPPYDHTYDNFDPALEECNPRNWNDGGEEMEVKVDNEEQDNTELVIFCISQLVDGVLARNPQEEAGVGNHKMNTTQMNKHNSFNMNKYNNSCE
ncbi:hypothetical protein BDR05DRAFT_953728 [Suillus weaverae]|nr:hypothetical protein BDR05DRAFT_953728 [Suillus weaverae]